MRDEGGGKEGLTLETPSRLFPQQSPPPVPQCGGGGRTIRENPQKIGGPLRPERRAFPPSAAILGPGGRTTGPSALGAAPPSCRRAARAGGGGGSRDMALFPAFAGAAQPGVPLAGSSKGSTRGKVLGEPSFP